MVTVRVTTEGAAVIRHLLESGGNCAIPTSVRPFFWSNDNGEGAYDRWWSNPRALALTEGTASVSVPLTPPHWSSVDGRFGNADATVEYHFGGAVRRVTRVGLTFGGGCSFGHGVRVHDGRAAFALTGYRIE